MRIMKKTKEKMGTFQGVFTPSILTILGVVMYLRMGFIVGHGGLFSTLFIITIATSITFLTALSISQIATNMSVKGGGAYFMISRSLGLETGAAIGLPLYFAQAIGITFYVSGFSESIHQITGFPLLQITLVTLFILAMISYFSQDLAFKFQYFILLLIVSSLVSFFIGSSEQENILHSTPIVAPNRNFWELFAIFFPAVTGIEVGLSMSGKLSKPESSLPKGTLSAVLVGYVVYITISIYLFISVSSSELKSNPFVMLNLSVIKELVFLGLWGASISSALGGLLGAPQTLQALAKDKIVPLWLSREFGSSGVPRYAILVTFFIALFASLLGDLNTIAPVLSMFFLASYGVINFSATIESLIANPSWRPKFKIHWFFSFLGTVFCFVAMVMINAGSALIAIAVTLSIYYFIQSRRLRAYWGDIRRGMLMLLAKFSVEKLAKLPLNQKSWRPNILVFSGTPNKRWPLIELGHAIANDRSFLTVASVYPSKNFINQGLADAQKTYAEYLYKKKMQPLVRISVADSLYTGILSLVRDYGLGELYPNTIILGVPRSRKYFSQFIEMIIHIFEAKRNILIIKYPYERVSRNEKLSDESNNNLHSIKNYFHNKDGIKINIWWGRLRKNAGLSLAFSYLIQNNSSWPDVDLYVKSIGRQASNGKVSTEEILKQLIAQAKIDAKAQVFDDLDNKEEIFEKITLDSKDCNLSFLGLLPPNLKDFSKNPKETIENYQSYFEELLDLTKNMPPVAFVLANEDLDFHKIFQKQNK
ncbi:MAG: Na-K-Cl cotransporter [Zetaproteobacteria bacterium]|nr:Na-K-Cl cotransporter [Pseudobdellovibrionaceae bacterium]